MMKLWEEQRAVDRASREFRRVVDLFIQIMEEKGQQYVFLLETHLNDVYQHFERIERSLADLDTFHTELSQLKEREREYRDQVMAGKMAFPNRADNQREQQLRARVGDAQQSIVFACQNIALTFQPAAKKKTLKEFCARRGAILCEALGIVPGTPLVDDAYRHSLVHADERLDEHHLQGGNKVTVIDSISPFGGWRTPRPALDPSQIVRTSNGAEAEVNVYTLDEFVRAAHMVRERLPLALEALRVGRRSVLDRASQDPPAVL